MELRTQLYLLTYAVSSEELGLFQWTMTSFHNHLDYADEIYLRQMALDLETGSRFGLKINTNKSNVLSLTAYCTLPICINWQDIEAVDRFVYLGNVVSADGDT